jgi:hypothetical protein
MPVQQPNFNHVQKPADVIARGPHVFDEASHQYKEIGTYQPSEHVYPRAMFHQDLPDSTANSLAEQREMEAQGWSVKPSAAKPKKETVVTPSADLALIVLQQQQMMQQMKEKLEALEEKQPTTAPAIADGPRRPGRPAKPEAEQVGA